MLNIPELNSFIKSVERDNDAIINAIYYRYTNGLAEGFVNKLKTIKRSMYGKATFQGLRRKILWQKEANSLFQLTLERTFLLYIKHLKLLALRMPQKDYISLGLMKKKIFQIFF